MKKTLLVIVYLLTAIMTTLHSASAADEPAKTKPVKIYILSGQSNMTGRGTLGNLKEPPADQKATLVRYIMEPKNKEKYKCLYDGQQKTPDGWTIRDDVFITIGEWPHCKPGEEGYTTYRKHGGLAPYYGGFRNKGFGPELAIGHALGDYHDELVLLVKVSFGGNTLAGNFRSPGSGGKLGDKYPMVIKSVRDAIEHLPEIIPGYTKQQGYEIAGFFWNQGFSDTGKIEYASEYYKNLENLIKDIRKEFNKPQLKTVVAVTGNYGWDLADMLKWQKTEEKKKDAAERFHKVTDAQVAISKNPKFKGTVATAETRDFWRPIEIYGGNKQGHHWGANGESYWLIGEEMGRQMIKLLQADKISPDPRLITLKKPTTVLLDEFRKLKFGMFIHYNMATYHNAQWVEGYPDPSTFNPDGKVDTDAWADAAVAAGMKYAVLTAKHVAGFCLWDSKYTTYDVMHPDCPYQQDFVAQFIKSFKSRGLKVGLYYCWRHPGFDQGNKGKNKGKFKVLPPECDPATHDLKEQIEFQKKQIAELIEKYPDVFYIWNDALDDVIMTAEDAKAFFSNNRQVLTSANWWSWAKKGTPFMDIPIKEMRHFPETNKVPGETCWELESKWFWNADTKTRTVESILDQMNKACHRNSNFLLNVGPDKNGKIIDTSVKALEEIGTLLRTNNTKKQIPAVLPAPDNTPPDQNKPVKVYILAGQSNMVGIGQVSGGSTRWGNEFIDPVVSIYPGKYSPTADYDNMTPTETKKLTAFGGIEPTPYPKGGTAVTRGFIKFNSDGVYEFNAGYGESSESIMEIDGKEVYRGEPGKQPVRSGFKFTAGKKYPFKITYLNESAGGLGWLWRTDLPGTLDTVVKTDKKFTHLIDEKGNWTVRNDVWYKGVVTATANKWLTIGCGAGETSIGPELQFGHIMGYYHDEPVIILKASQGNRSLGWDFLPPSGKQFTDGEYTYAGYKDSPDRWETGTIPKPIGWYAGKQYDDCFRAAHDVLDNFDKNFPQWKGQGYDIAGFVWWQGHKDGGSDVHANRYEQNLVNLINSLRSEFKAPKAQFVIATIGFGGWKMSGNHKTIANAQLAVSGEKGKYPEFKGNVLTVEIRDFWREPDVSPRNQDFHYNGNAETYMLVGDALGRGMVKLKNEN